MASTWVGDVVAIDQLPPERRGRRLGPRCRVTASASGEQAGAGLSRQPRLTISMPSELALSPAY